MFDLEVETPLGNQSPPEHVVWRKNGGDSGKNVFSRAAQEITKKINKKTFNMIFHPNAGGPLLGRLF